MAVFRHPLFKSAVDIYFEKFIGDEEALRERLISSCYPIKDEDFGISKKGRRGGTGHPADLSYVTVDRDDIFSTENVDPDKRRAIVVAGECGSGKTMFCIGDRARTGTPPNIVKNSTLPV